MDSNTVRRHRWRRLDWLLSGFSLNFGFPSCFGVLPLSKNSVQGKRFTSDKGAATAEASGTTQRKMRSEDLGDELLPGVLNDITLELIAPKLSWKDFHVLSSVSRDWRQAIQGHLLHDARVRHHSTETFVVLCHCKLKGTCYTNDVHSLGLYSKKERSVHQLPFIPGLPTGIPLDCQCISLDGRIYILGGRTKWGPNSLGLSEVYVLDLAGQREWTQCASMAEPRSHFGTGVMGGKIYVFGGMSGDTILSGSEVYDPKANAWSPIKCSPSLRYCQHVSTLFNELVIHGGFIEVPIVQDRVENQLIEDNERVENRRRWYVKDGICLDVYNPVKDHWRKVEAFEKRHGAEVFVAEGRFYAMNESCIRERDDNSWNFFRRNSFSGCDSMENARIVPLATVALDAELLAIVKWSIGLGERRVHGTALLRGEGFQQGDSIEWEIICSIGSPGPWCLASRDLPFLCPIEL